MTSNKELIRRVYAAFGTGDIATVLSVLVQRAIG
jgi:ketosteroid isomerase-like protein